MMDRLRTPMPPLIYGTAWKKDQTADYIIKAIAAGFRGIDTACQPKHYNEPGVGDAIKTLAAKGIPRHHIFLQTKFTPLAGQDAKSVPYDPKAPLDIQVHQSFIQSLTNLGTDHIDSLVLHSPLSSLVDTMTVWKAFEELYYQGKVSLLGISNCYDITFMERFYSQALIKPRVLQNRFYKETGYDRDLRMFSKKNGIIYQSFWTLTANPHLLNHPVFIDTAKHLGKTPAQILFRYLIEDGSCPLTGTTSKNHMQQDLDVCNFRLGDDIRATLEQVIYQS